MMRSTDVQSYQPRPGSSIGAFCTIGEAAAQVDVAPHVLRFWESKINHIRPHKHGRWRYYRSEDIALLRRVRSLLHERGYTLRGVQRLLDSENGQGPAPRDMPANHNAPGRPTELPRRVSPPQRGAKGREIEDTLQALGSALAALRKRLEVV